MPHLPRFYHNNTLLQGVSVNYCQFQLNSALANANLFIWKQCQSNKQGFEIHIWIALWMTWSMWAPWDSRTAGRRNKKFCTTRMSIPVVTCAQLSLILSFSSGRVGGHFILQITPEGSAASDHRIPLQTSSAFLATQLSETVRHESCTEACVRKWRWQMCLVICTFTNMNTNACDQRKYC